MWGILGFFFCTQVTDRFQKLGNNSLCYKTLNISMTSNMSWSWRYKLSGLNYRHCWWTERLKKYIYIKKHSSIVLQTDATSLQLYFGGDQQKLLTTNQSTCKYPPTSKHKKKIKHRSCHFCIVLMPNETVMKQIKQTCFHCGD